MNIELTENETKTLKFYVEKALIDAEGLCAIGVVSKNSVTNLKSVLRKIDQIKK